MNTKINLFTALIIVYSIVVCSVFKKSDSISNQSAKFLNNTTNHVAVENKGTLTKEILTASIEVPAKQLPQ